MKYNMSDDFRGHEDMKVPLPQQGIDKILIPQLFIRRYAHPTGHFEKEANGDFKRQRVPHKNRKTGEITYTNEKIPITRPAWKISKITDNKSINKTRQISSRRGKPVLDLKTAKVDKVQEEHHYIPRLADFPNLEDRRMIFEYLTHLSPDEELSFPENKTRGRPPILPANWEHHNLGPLPKNYIVKEKKKKEVSHEDIFGSDTEPESESDEDLPVVPFAKKQKGGAGGGYVQKGSGINPCWEGYEMIGMKMKKGKKVPNCVEKGGTLKSSVAKGDEGIKEDTLKNYTMFLKHLESHITDPKEPVDPKDYLQSNKIIKAIKKLKGGELPDFENIKWGTFKSLYNRFLKSNPEFKDKIEDLQHFAHFVVANPDKFSKIAEKKALFYINILEHKSEGGKLSKIGQVFNKAFNPQKNGFLKKNKPPNYSNDTLTNNDFN